VERIFIEGKARPVWAPSPRALVPALLVHLALLPFALLSFNPPLLEEAPPTVVEIAFLELPKEPEAASPPPEDTAPTPEPPAANSEPEPAPAPVVAVPDVDLPQTSERSAEERAAAEALSSYLCVFAEEDERARAECEARQQARALANGDANSDRVIDESHFTRMAVSLGLMLDPRLVPPVENPALDPYAPDDTSYENPINDIRDPIPGVIHN